MMFEVLVQMGGLILCGIGWRWFQPAGLQHAQTRKVLTSLVYYLLLPALVLSVLWKAQLGNTTLLIALSAALGILVGALLSSLSCRLCGARPAVTGAVILAATFPNATYLGLPVLEATFGAWARSVAIQYDLFACTPLLFTLGVLPAIVDGLLGLLERGVVPLMLFSLGLSLEWNRSQWRTLPTVVPVLLLRLLLIPAVIAWFASVIGLSGELYAAVVMETAMPSMVLGIVFCDRFNLDVGLYATAVTLSTVLSVLTLPMWYQWLLA
jgi:predicted permease